MTSSSGNEPRVGIVVLNWNGLADTLACLESISRLSYPCTSVLVVDNASANGDAEQLETLALNARVLALTENLGYAGGMNRGIEEALAEGCDFVLLLNNDTVLAPDLLDRMLAAAAAHPRAGLISADIRPTSNPEGHPGIVTHFDWRTGFGRTTKFAGASPRPVKVEVVTGCTVLVRKELVERVGLLDERYFLYFEDLDWSVRARRSGFECLYVPGAVVWHRGSASTRGRTLSPRPTFYYYHTRNNILFVRQWGGSRSRLSFTPFVLWRTICTTIRVLGGGLLAGKRNVSARIRALWLGFVDGWRGRWGMVLEPDRS